MEQTADDKRADTSSLQHTVNEKEHLADRSESASKAAFQDTSQDTSQDIADNGTLAKIYRQTTINLAVAALPDIDTGSGQWNREFDVSITDANQVLFANDPDAHRQWPFFNVLERAVLPAGEIINGTVHFYLEHAKRNINPAGEVFDIFDVHTEGNIYVKTSSPALSNKIPDPYFADIYFPEESYRAFINITDLLTEVHHEK